MATNKEFYAYALGYYYGRAEGNDPGLFDGEPEQYLFKQGYESGVSDYCEEDIESEAK